MQIEITGAPALALKHKYGKVANLLGGKATWNQVIMYLIKQDEKVKALEIRLRNREDQILRIKDGHTDSLDKYLTMALQRPAAPMMVGMQQRMDLPYGSPPETLSRPPPPPPGARITAKATGNDIRDLSTELKDAVKFGSPSRIVEALYGEKYERPPETIIKADLQEHPDPNFYKVEKSKELTKQGLEFNEINKALGIDKEEILDEEE